MIKKLLSTLLCVSMIIASSAVYAADGTSDLVNVALNKSIEITTGAPGDPAFVKENLIDGNTGNIADVLWDNEHTGVGYIIDLGKNYQISELKLYAISGNGSGRDQVWMDYSTDKSSWTNVYTRNNDVSDGFSSSSMTENTLTVNSFGTVTARYIKVTSWTYTCWTEFEVYALMPKLVDTTISGRVITTEFSADIAPASITADSFKVYADNQLLTLDTDYSISVSGKNVSVTLVRDYYDTEFKIEATTAVKSTNDDALTALATDTVTAPLAIEISGFAITEETNNAKVDVTIRNNTSTENTTAVVFAFLLDEKNIVIGRDMWTNTITAGQQATPQLNISTSGISGNCKVKAFVWKDLSGMQVWAQAQSLNLN